MTNNQQKIFFGILRSSIWGKPIDVDIPKNYNWKHLFDSYENQALLGVIANTLYFLPKEIQLSEEQKDHIFSYVSNLKRTHYKHQNAIVKVFEGLSAVGCNPILLKGESLSLLYPDTSIRSCGDIDIYVGEQPNGSVTRYTLANNYFKSICTSEEFENTKESVHHFEVCHEGISYEIHRQASRPGNLIYSDKYTQISERYLNSEDNSTIKINNADINIPSEQFNILYVFNHLVMHLWEGGLSLRQLVDWALLLRKSIHNNIDTKQLHRDLKACGLLKIWQVLGGIIVWQLGYPKDKFPFWNEKNALSSQDYLLRTIVNGSNFHLDTKANNQYRNKTGIKRFFSSIIYHINICHPLIYISWHFAIVRFVSYANTSLKSKVLIK